MSDLWLKNEKRRLAASCVKFERRKPREDLVEKARLFCFGV